MAPILSIENLTVAFASATGASGDLWAVDDVSLAVEQGSFTALVGESGSGKSLTCLSVLALVGGSPWITGQVTFDGAAFPAGDVTAAELLRGARIGMIFQDPTASLNPVRRIGAQMVETIRIHDRRLSRQEAKQKAQDLLDQVGIDQPAHRLRQYPHELSGGMNQRVMIALALAGDPELLIADEPTTALDASTQVQILDLIDRLRVDWGMSVLLISHDMALVRDYADTVYVMQHGKIAESGAVGALIASPRHPHTRDLMHAVGVA